MENFYEKIRPMFMKNFIEFQWNSMEFSGIPWNFPFNGIP
jgi:hypothetical protein